MFKFMDADTFPQAWEGKFRYCLCGLLVRGPGFHEKGQFVVQS